MWLHEKSRHAFMISLWIGIFFIWIFIFVLWAVLLTVRYSLKKRIQNELKDNGVVSQAKIIKKKKNDNYKEIPIHVTLQLPFWILVVFVIEYLIYSASHIHIYFVYSLIGIQSLLFFAYYYTNFILQKKYRKALKKENRVLEIDLEHESEIYRNINIYERDFWNHKIWETIEIIYNKYDPFTVYVNNFEKVWELSFKKIK